MIPAAVPIVTSLIPTGFKLLSAHKQKKQAEELLRKNPRPTQGVESEYYQNLNMAMNRASSNMPGTNYMRNKIGGNAANAVNSAVQVGQSPDAILGTIAAVNDNSNNAYADLEYQNSLYRDKGLDLILNANEKIAQEKKSAWEWNSKQKYLDAVNAASALQNAAGQNTFSGLNDLAKTAMYAFNSSSSSGGAAGMPASSISTPSPVPGSTPASTGGMGQNESLFNSFKTANPSLSDDQIWKLIQGGLTDSNLASMLAI